MVVLYKKLPFAAGAVGINSGLGAFLLRYEGRQFREVPPAPGIPNCL